MGKSKGSSGKGSANATTRNVYADGSTIRNGLLGAKSGIGIYFSDGSRYNSSVPVKGAQNSGRAEAAAISKSYRAISREVASGSGSKHYTIRSDSQYGIGVAKGNIKGCDEGIAKSISDHSRNLKTKGVHVGVSYIPGHCGHSGNESAHKLANEAASRK